MAQVLAADQGATSPPFLASADGTVGGHDDLRRGVSSPAVTLGQTANWAKITTNVRVEPRARRHLSGHGRGRLSGRPLPGSCGKADPIAEPRGNEQDARKRTSLHTAAAGILFSAF